MRNMKNTFIRLFFVTVVFVVSSCNDYLDKKPDDSFALPQTLDDLEGLLNSSDLTMNFAAVALGEIASDSYYLDDASWRAMPNESDRTIYTWQPYSPEPAHWTLPYQAILYANAVLEYLPGIAIPENEMHRAERLRGSALFFRAHQLFNLLHVFSKPYLPGGGNTQMGVVLRSKASLSEELKRSSVEECYDFLIRDLKEASELLPEAGVHATQPTKAAAYGELARVFLVRGDMANAKEYADSALFLQSDLMDYQNDIDPAANLPIPRWNKEVLVDLSLNGHTFLNTARIRIPLKEYNNYENTDIRKQAFFTTNANGEIIFKGNYNARNGNRFFCGPTTSEMYLIRAEANIRQNLLSDGLKDINYLRKHRFREDDFLSLDFDDKEQALTILKEERRRELIFRGVRWSDIRRYIILDETEGGMERLIDGNVYKMTAEDIIGYVYKLPDAVIDSGNLSQND
jgi:hypothetical protein